jgi:hypothetical protein
MGLDGHVEKIEGKIKRGGRREGQPKIHATTPVALQYARAREIGYLKSTFTWSASVDTANGWSGDSGRQPSG